MRRWRAVIGAAVVIGVVIGLAFVFGPSLMIGISKKAAGPPSSWPTMEPTPGPEPTATAESGDWWAAFTPVPFITQDPTTAAGEEVHAPFITGTYESAWPTHDGSSTPAFEQP